MLPYDSFFLIVLVSILGPVVGLLALIFYNLYEKQVYVLKMENQQAWLEKELETSRYIQLNQQIQPHFLFNALNSMLGLLRLKKYDGLTQTFEHMVLFLRSKYKDKEPLYTLEEEISYTKNYVAIQQLRYGERLEAQWEIDPAAEEALTIPDLLQTLVENAFKHGFDMVEGEALLKVRIQSVDGQKIEIEVEDNGPGFSFHPLAAEKHSGVGLRNIHRRLQLLFGEQASIMIPIRDSVPSGGRITVSWPLIYGENH